MRIVLAALAVSLLAACATATPYQPRDRATGGYGFTESQIESNRFRVSFSGNSLTDRETVENYLLFRAADLTVQHGYDYFVVADRGTREHSTLQSMGPYHAGFAPYYFYRTRRGWLPYYDPFFDQPQSYQEIERYEASAEIAMFHGRKPTDNASAFDAREVVANLQSKVTRPPATN